MYVNLGGPQHTAEARPSSRYRHLSQHANGEVTTWYVTCGPGQGRPPSRDLVHGTEADFTVGLGIGPPFLRFCHPGPKRGGAPLGLPRALWPVLVARSEALYHKMYNLNNLCSCPEMYNLNKMREKMLRIATG
jgi:hypothetical protein